MQQNRITIPLLAPCKTQCVFCKFKKPDEVVDSDKEWEKVQKRIAEAGNHSAQDVGFGHYVHEPAEFPFLAEALSILKKHKKRTFINSNGKKLANLTYAKTLKGLLDRVNISIFCDTDDECSFYMQEDISYKHKLQAIENSLANNIHVTVTIILLKPSLKKFKEILYLTKKFWNNKYFDRKINIVPVAPIMGKVRNKALVLSYSEIKKLIKDNVDELELLHKKYCLNFLFKDIPQCFWLDVPEGVSFFYESSDENKKEIETKTADDITLKSYAQQCKSCEHFNTCSGVYSGYLILYGEEEFDDKEIVKPISLEGAKKIIDSIEDFADVCDKNQVARSDEKYEKYYKTYFPFIEKLYFLSLYQLTHASYTKSEIYFNFLSIKNNATLTVSLSKEYEDYYMRLSNNYRVRYEKSGELTKQDLLLLALVKKIFLKENKSIST